MKPHFISLSLLAMVHFASITSGQTTFLIDFGAFDRQTTPADDPINTWSNFTTGLTNLNLVDTTGSNSDGYALELTTTFTSRNLVGPAATTIGDLSISTATSDSLYTTGTGQVATLILSGLNSDTLYNFSFFGSRDTTSTRLTTYRVSGSTTESQELQTSGVDLGGSGINMNNSSTSNIGNIAPDGSMNITIDIFIADSSSSYGYLNALQITTSPIPEPTTSGIIMGMSAILAIFYIKRKTRKQIPMS
ncbi:hypothetical protein [Rubellicoccus peritrichatus]|uniref:PEP-CTERM protein-sorting domain-containing protein n=1 Tax=Rubellicoccus peritrichatus TaxID=3080537 RepID=A0AAQ3L5R7_9BACT|nr:hypothetical protein [Puniceicoccus sp. CR14]WOO39725.1 hypothetical protein RZN69_13965 [Puniceicoccus sp. CR14]